MLSDKAASIRYVGALMVLPLIAAGASALGVTSGALGGALLAGGGAVLGSAADRYFDKKALEDRYGFLASKGLTPQEIQGVSGLAGGAGSNVGSVLGNQQAELARIRQQQEYDERQRNIDRAVTMRGQDAQVQSAQTAAGASMYATDVGDRFRRDALPAQMGVENMQATALARMFAIDPSDPNLSLTREQYRVFNEAAMMLNSTLARETIGAKELTGRISDWVEEYGGGFIRRWNEAADSELRGVNDAERRRLDETNPRDEEGRRGGQPLRLTVTPDDR
jgi:hypothetical protein